MNTRAALVAGTALLLGGGALRAATGSGVLDDFDVLYFVRGVEDYAVHRGRPHFPGYPVFIGAARLLRPLAGDALSALHAVAVVSSTLAAVPLALVAFRLRREAGGMEGEAATAALVAAALWLVVPASWITGGEGFSDAPGLLLAAAVLWLSSRALEGSVRAAAAAGILGGLLLGTRLAYVSLLAPLALLAATRPSTPTSRARLALAAGAGLAAGVLPWLAFQLAHEGQALVQAAHQHVGQHFSRWGNSVWTDPDLRTRPLRFLRVFVVYGLGGWTPGMGPARLLATAAWAGFLAAGLWRLGKAGGPMRRAFLAWVAAYVVHVGLAHDPDIARYGLPVAAAACVVAGAGVPGGSRGLLAGAGLATLLAGITFPLALERRRTPPTEVQVAEYVSRLPLRETALLTPPPAEVVRTFLAGRAPGLHHLAVEEGAIGEKTRLLEEDGRTVYSLATDPRHPEEWTPAARFCRTPLFDPRSPAEIWLYRHQPGAEVAPVPACDQSFDVR